MKRHDDNPEWTKEDFARAKPASEVIGKDAAAALVRKPGRPKLARADRKQQVNMRFSPDLLEGLRNTGPGWQGRIEEVLRHALDEGLLETQRKADGSLFERIVTARKEARNRKAPTLKRSAKTGEFVTGSNDEGPGRETQRKSKKV